MKTGRIGQIVSLIALLVLLPGCLRYVPASSVPEATSEAQLGQMRGMLAGPEAFYAFEQVKDEMLHGLMRKRRAGLQGKTLGSYEVGPGDLLKIDVFGVSDLRTELAVEPSGTIQLPLIGEVVCEGREVWEVRQEIARRLKHYVRSPQVQLTVKEYRAHQVSVIGEVEKPGMYPITKVGQSVIELLSSAGGRTEKAGNRVLLIPALSDTQMAEDVLDAQLTSLTQENSEQSFMSPVSNYNGMGQNTSGLPMTTLDEEPSSEFFSENYYTAFNAPPREDENEDEGAGVFISVDRLMGADGRRPYNFPLHAGDTLVVLPAGKFAVDGEVSKPGAYPLTERTSVLGAVAAAGGLTYSANVSQVELIRDIGDGKKAMLTLDLEAMAMNTQKDIVLHNGDVVRVPSDPVRFGRRQVVEFINSVFNVGVNSSVR